MGKASREKTERRLARKHHFLPQAYLRSFLVPQETSKNLRVYDLETGASFKAPVDKIACERDYFAIADIDGRVDDGIETTRAEIEGHLAPSLKRLADMDFSAFEEDTIFALWLAGMIHQVAPALREGLHDGMRQVSRLLKDGWDALGKTSPEERVVDWGGVVLRETEVAEMLSDLSLRNFSARASLDFSTLRRVHELMLERDWTVSIASPDAGLFVTTDHPVVLAWAKEPTRKWSVPNLASREAQVIFPVGPRVVLSGNFDRADLAPVVCGPAAVALTNSMILSHARRWVYASNDDSLCIEQATWPRPTLLRESVKRLAEHRARPGR